VEYYSCSITVEVTAAIDILLIMSSWAQVAYIHCIYKYCCDETSQLLWCLFIELCQKTSRKAPRPYKPNFHIPYYCYKWKISSDSIITKNFKGCLPADRTCTYSLIQYICRYRQSLLLYTLDLLLKSLLILKLPFPCLLALYNIWYHL